ncbi:MAG TPA: phosphoglycerate dehydrogenase, partial [Acidobacteriota bacterium]|nr:phosphoglycerate dehydrogenase [Acidobacteriota bacterium]
EKGPLGAVGMDVFPDEPPDPAHPLLGHARAYVTGHIAARTPLSQQRILETMVREVRAILNGTQPNLANVVNPEVFED